MSAREDRCRCCGAFNLSKRSRDSLVLHEINQAAEFDEKYKERPSLNAVGWLAALAFGICWDCWFGAIGFLSARSLARIS
jgi:hypothetical protein